MADPVSPGYTVDDMQKSTEPDGSGDYQDVWKVNYTTAGGVKSHVKLPATHLTAANVHNLIHHEKKHIDAVQSLPANMPDAPVEA